MRIQVKDFMSVPVYTTVAGTSVSYIRELMERKSVHAIPIVEVNEEEVQEEIKIRGIITNTDLRGITDEETLVDDLMTEQVHVVSKNANAQSAAGMMLRHRVHHLVVMDEGRIIGMLSAMDFVRLVADHELE